MDKRGSAVALALFIDLCWACGGSPTQPARPDTPPATGSPGSLVVKLDAKADELGSRDAVMALSEVIADASASTGATPLTYSLDFGDGFVTTAATTRHVYRSAGTFTITATVTDAQGRKASESRQMTVKTLNGRWFEAEFVRRSQRVEVRRLAVTSQDGLTIGGVYEITDAPERRFTGTLIAPRSVRIALDGGASLEGSIPGRLNDEAETWSLQARGDTVDGERLEFRSIPGDPTGPGPDADFKLSFDGGPGRPFAAVTPVVIDATLSRGTGLLYFVEFGDGFVTTKARDSHIVDVPDPPPFPRRPPLKARVTVVDRFGRSNAESADYFVFELGLHLPGEIDYQYWGAVGFTIDFVERHGATYIGQAERFRQFRTTARATLSGNGDIRITLEAVGIEYRGRIERIPSGDIIMRVVQSGGPDDGRAWELYLSSTF